MGQAEQAVNEPNTLKISECKPIIRRAIQKRRPIFIWGPPGVGKSDMVDQVASEVEKSLVIDMRMALMDPTDIKGVPYYSANDNTMKWAPHPNFQVKNLPQNTILYFYSWTNLIVLLQQYKRRLIN